MAQPTSEDIANAIKYAEAMLEEEMGHSDFAFLPDGFVQFRLYPEDSSYPCPFQDKSACPREGYYAFTKRGCQEMSCNPYVRLRGRRAGTTMYDEGELTRATRGLYQKYCYLDEVSVPTFFNKANVAGKGKDEEEKDIKIVREDNRNNDPDTLLHAWAKLPREKEEGCYAAPAITYVIGKSLGMPVASLELGAPTEPSEYKATFQWYGQKDSVAYGMPLLYFDKHYCEKRVYVSYDEKSKECYVGPGQYIAEEVFMGKLYREILRKVRGED